MATSYERVLGLVSLRSELDGTEHATRTTPCDAERLFEAGHLAYIYVLGGADDADDAVDAAYLDALDRQRRLRQRRLWLQSVLERMAAAAAAHALLVCIAPREVYVVDPQQRMRERNEEAGHAHGFASVIYDACRPHAVLTRAVLTRAEDEGHPALGSTDIAVLGYLLSTSDHGDSVWVDTKYPASFASPADGTRQRAGLLQRDARHFGPGKATLRAAVIAGCTAQSEGSTVPRTVDPSLNRRKLRIALRQAREEASLSQRETAQHLKWPLSKLIRVESGTVSTSVKDLRMLMELYGITEPARTRDLEEAARNSRGKSWWSSFNDVARPLFARYLGYETTSVSPRAYHPLLVVPDLPRAERYTERAVPRSGVRHWGTEPRTVGHERDFDQFNDAIRACGVMGGTTLRHALARSVIVRPQPEQLTCASGLHSAAWAPATEYSPSLTELRCACAGPRQGLCVASFGPHVTAPPSAFVPSSWPREVGVYGLGMSFARAVASAGWCGRKAELLQHLEDGDRASFFYDRAAHHGCGSNRLTVFSGRAQDCVIGADGWIPSRARHQRLLQQSRNTGRRAAGRLRHRFAPPTGRSAQAPAGCHPRPALRSSAQAPPRSMAERSRRR